MSAFDQLERQLLDSVGERSRSRRLELLAGLPSRWRGRFGQGKLVLAASLIATVAALAVWAGPASHGPSPEARMSASVLERTCAPCQAFGGRLHGHPAAAYGAAAATQALGRTTDRRGLSVVRWSQEELSANPGESLPSAG